MLHRIIVIILLLGAAAPAMATERSISFGSVSLVENTPDPQRLPILDVPAEGDSLHLRWRAPTGDFKAELVDNGSTLGIEMSGHDCSSFQSHLRYERHLGEDALWRRMALLLRDLTRICSRITPGQAAHYKQELQAAQDDYVAAVEAMKRRAVTLFQRPLTRCRPPRRPPNPFDFYPSCEGEY
jgi:hypothetical protein